MSQLCVTALQVSNGSLCVLSLWLYFAFKSEGVSNAELREQLVSVRQALDHSWKVRDAWRTHAEKLQEALREEREERRKERLQS